MVLPTNEKRAAFHRHFVQKTTEEVAKDEKRSGQLYEKNSAGVWLWILAVSVAARV